MWTIIFIVIAFLLFGTIRGAILANKQYEVVNQEGKIIHWGKYHECCKAAKQHNEYCKAFGIVDRFKVMRRKT